jgi:hypothetical protein
LVQRYLSGAIGTTTELKAEIEDYRLTKTKDDFEARMKKSNLEAMELFTETAPALDFGEAKLTIGPHTGNRRQIAGVGVSVLPDLYLTTGGGNEPLRVGAIKLNIAKGAVHGKDAADFVGALLRTHVEDGCDPGECDHQICFAMDIFGAKLVASPKAIVNRMKDIEAACGEIARQWPSITPS